MAKKTKSASVPTLRGAVVRIQREGKLAIGLVEREIRALVRRTRADVSSDMAGVRRELVTRVQQVEREFERRVAAVETGVRARLGVAGAQDVSKLLRQVTAIEGRVAEIERRTNELTDQLHDLLPSAPG